MHRKVLRTSLCIKKTLRVKYVLKTHIEKGHFVTFAGGKMGKVLLFHVNIIKANSIIKVCKELSHSAAIIPKTDYAKPLGLLAGMPGMKDNSAFSGKEFENEMMVFSGMSSDELDLFLDRYKKAGIGEIKRKAVLTASNMLWTPVRLYGELDEHVK